MSNPNRTLAGDLGFTEDDAIAAQISLQQAIPPDISEVTFNTSEVQETAKNDLDFLAAIVLPEIYRYKFPPVYLAVWSWLTTYVSRGRDFSQLALGLPRGFAKTTLIKLFIVFVILFTKRRFIIVFCENQTKANNIVADVMDMLSSPNIKVTFGDWAVNAETDRQDLKKFGFRGRNIVLMAGTVETSRGINLKNERPDVQIFDDIQSRDCAESQIQSDALEREMIGTAMKAKSPHGCLFVFIANMYPTKWSILRKLKKNPTWVKFICGGILEDGTSLWEDLQPIAQLMREFENDLASGHPEIFYSEVLNDENASANSLIDLSKLPEYTVKDDDIPAGNFIVIDPAGSKKTSDLVSIGYFEVHNGYPFLIDVVEDHLSPGDTIREALKFALNHNCRLIVIEGTAYQASLSYWFHFIAEQQMQIRGLQCVEIYPGSVNKNSRIIGTIKAYGAGEFYVHPRCRAQVHTQIIQFNPLKRDNTDGILDLLGYCSRILQEFGEYITSYAYIEHQEWQSLEVPEFNSPF